jgi:hypothetical protein
MSVSQASVSVDAPCADAGPAATPPSANTPAPVESFRNVRLCDLIFMNTPLTPRANQPISFYYCQSMCAEWNNERRV